MAIWRVAAKQCYQTSQFQSDKNGLENVGQNQTGHQKQMWQNMSRILNASYYYGSHRTTQQVADFQGLEANTGG